MSMITRRPAPAMSTNTRRPALAMSTNTRRPAPAMSTSMSTAAHVHTLIRILTPGKGTRVHADASTATV